MKKMDGTLHSDWKVIFDRHHAALAEELSSRLEAGLADAASRHDQALEDHRAQAAEELRQATEAARLEALEQGREQGREEAARAAAAEYELVLARAVEEERAQNAAKLEAVAAENADALVRTVEQERGQADDRVRLAREHARAEAFQSTQRITAEALNQVVRRLRNAPSEAAVLQLLSSGTTPWAPQAGVFQVEEERARSLVLRDIEIEGKVQFELSAAGAFQSTVETRDPVVAVASESEVSNLLAEALPVDSDGCTPMAYLFPVTVRQSVVAVLFATGKVVPAPLELLCEAAGMKLEMLTAPAMSPLKSPELVQIAAAAVPAAVESVRAAQSPRTWEDLSADDQKLHLQAQRVARVKVAELRLYHAEELRKGVFAGDIYTALQTGIDAARAEFLQTFLSKSPTMVDYLHLEILRSLAHDDDRLLGLGYPGPMV